MGLSELQAEALKLTEEERLQLVGSILESLPAADPNESDRDNLSEAIQRGEELKSEERRRDRIQRGQAHFRDPRVSQKMTVMSHPRIRTDLRGF